MKTTPAGGDEVEKNPGVGSGWGWRADGYYTVQPTAWRGVPSTRTQTHEHETTGTSYLAWPANKSGPLRWAGLGFWPSQGPSAVGNPEWEGGDGRRRRAGWRNLRIHTYRTVCECTSTSYTSYCIDGRTGSSGLETKTDPGWARRDMDGAPVDNHLHGLGCAGLVAWPPR